MFATKYRIVGDRFAGYEAQYKKWYFPFWLQIGINTHTSPELAEAFIKRQAFCKEVELS